MSSTDQIEVMFVEELLELLSAKDIAAASLILLPISDIFIRVIPKQISHESFIRNVRGLCKLRDVGEILHRFRNTAMHTHDFFVYESH
jgi:hypothetical protein